MTRFMGHDIAIHREYYQLPEDTLQLAKCSKIMLLMEKGVIGSRSGKSLSQIESNLGKRKLMIFLDPQQSQKGLMKSLFSVSPSVS